MSISFRPQQQAALDFKGNVAVSAGAGSGKTRVLVEKYFRLLVDEHPNWPVGSVVAITFTIKAAAELRARIVRRVLDELKKADNSPARRERLKQIRREIADAPIGTIHNFCARILRQFAFDCHITPDFAIIEGPQESSYRREAIELSFSRASGDKDVALFHSLLLLLTIYSRRALMGILDSMLRRRGELAPIVRSYLAHSTDDLMDRLRSYHHETTSDVRAKVMAELNRLLDLLPQVCLSIPAEVEQISHSLMKAAKEHDWTAMCELLASLENLLFTQKGTVRKAMEKVTGLDDSSSFVSSLREVCSRARSSTLGDLSEADRENLELTVHLCRLYNLVQEEYQKLKSAGRGRDSDLLDFTDLELKAHSLICNVESARHSLREQFNYLIIDEFQDTSEVQWQLLGPLVCLETEMLLPAHFFMVGDPKQSVYGFRQASTRIFNRIRDLVIVSNGATENASGAISISYNFRSRPKPLEFVNTLFNGLIRDNEQGAVFEPLIPQREDIPGHVQMTLVSPPDTMEDSEVGTFTRCPEAEIVAQQIAGLLKQGTHMAGDIAILFRKRRFFSDFEDALRELKIPFITHRGKGLFVQPEIADLMAILRLLANPADDYNALQVLRSQLFNFTDDLLLKLSFFSGKSLWNKVTNAERELITVKHGIRVHLTDAEHRNVEFIISLFMRHMSAINFRTVDEVLRELIEDIGALLIVNAGGRGEQASGNISRFIEVAQSSGTRDVEAFLEFIEVQAVDPQSEGEASNEFAGSNAVKIMTIHAAKGLEFPVVFLPQLHEAIDVRGSELMSDGFGWLALRKSKSTERESLFLYDHLCDLERKRALAEEKRVFYVAATRCRDELYLSAEEKESRESVWEWIKKFVTLSSCDEAAGGRTVPLVRVDIPTRKVAAPSKVSLHDGGLDQEFHRMKVDLFDRMNSLLMKRATPGSSHSARPFVPRGCGNWSFGASDDTSK